MCVFSALSSVSHLASVQLAWKRLLPQCRFAEVFPSWWGTPPTILLSSVCFSSVSAWRMLNKLEWLDALCICWVVSAVRSWAINGCEKRAWFMTSSRWAAAWTCCLPGYRAVAWLGWQQDGGYTVQNEHVTVLHMVWNSTTVKVAKSEKEHTCTGESGKKEMFSMLKYGLFRH